MTDVKTTTEILQAEAPKEVVLIGSLIPKANGGESYRLEPEGEEKPGVWFEKRTEGGIDVRRICAPLRVSAVDYDVNGEGFGITAEFHNAVGNLKAVRIGLDELSTAAEKLRGLGLSIDEAPGARQSRVPDYLNAVFQNYKQQGIPLVRRVTRVGWLSDQFTAFAFPDGVMMAPGEDSKERYCMDLPEGAPSFEVKGTLQQWQESIGLTALKSDRLMLSLCVGFAAPMIQLLGLQNSPGVHFYGGSSIGKSTAARGTASIFGSRFGTWRLTDNFAELVASSHNSLPMVLDEISQADRKTMELLYMIANGRGKGRMTTKGGAKKVFTWALTLVSTGEQTSDEAKREKTGKASAAGEEIRLINIPADVGAGNGILSQLAEGESAEAVVDAYTAAAQKYQGAAGRAFIKKLLEDVQVHGVESIRENFAGYAADFSAMASAGRVLDNQQQRVLRFFAAFAFAGELATNYGVLPWQERQAQAAALSCFAAWDSRAGSRRERIRDCLDALAFVDEEKAKRLYFKGGKLAEKSDAYSPQTKECSALVFAEKVRVLACYEPGKFREIINKMGAVAADVEAALMNVDALYFNDKSRREFRPRDENTKSLLPKSRYKAIFPQAVKNGAPLTDSQKQEILDLLKNA